MVDAAGNIRSFAVSTTPDLVDQVRSALKPALAKAQANATMNTRGGLDYYWGQLRSGLVDVAFTLAANFFGISSDVFDSRRPLAPAFSQSESRNNGVNTLLLQIFV